MPELKHKDSTLNFSAAKTPRYLQLAEKLKSDIEAGRLLAGEQLPSFLEMKGRYRLSHSTWDKTLGLLEAEGLIVREDRRGTFVAEASLRHAARATRAHYTLGVLGWGFLAREVFWTQVLDGIYEAAHEAGCDVTLLHRIARTAGWEKVDGVLISGDDKPQDILKSKPLNLPCVRLLIGANANIVIDVKFDEARGVQLAVRHLYELGHRRIAHLLTAPVDSLLRGQAYQAALRDCGLRPQRSWVRCIPDPSVYQENYFFNGAREGMRQWLRESWTSTACTALLCQNDQMALGAIAALREAGLNVPDDVSIVGFDGTEISQYSHPRLTTIKVPLREIGRRGAQMLLERIGCSDRARGARQKPIVLPVKLQIGESSAPPNNDLKKP